MASSRNPSTPISSQNSIDIEHGFANTGIIEIQVGLMRVEAMPIKGFGLIVPGPVRLFGVEEDDRGVLILLSVLSQT